MISIFNSGMPGARQATQALGTGRVVAAAGTRMQVVTAAAEHGRRSSSLPMDSLRACTWATYLRSRREEERQVVRMCGVTLEVSGWSWRNPDSTRQTPVDLSKVLNSRS